MRKIYKSRRDRRRAKSKARIRGTAERPRLVVFRSNKYIYSQIIDDAKRETLVAASNKDLMTDEKGAALKTQNKTEGTENSVSSEKLSVLSGSKTERAKLVGKLLARRALKKGIKKVVFDRAGYKYHGRVKALAEGAREGGLKF